MTKKGGQGPYKGVIFSRNHDLIVHSNNKTPSIPSLVSVLVLGGCALGWGWNWGQKWTKTLPEMATFVCSLIYMLALKPPRANIYSYTNNCICCWPISQYVIDLRRYRGLKKGSKMVKKWAQKWSKNGKKWAPGPLFDPL